MGPRGSVWNHESDKDLLLTIIAGRKLEGINWKDVADEMTKAGYTFTQEACRQHFQKIRRGSKAPRKEKGASAAATPTKRKATSTQNTPAKSSSQAHNNEDDEDDEAFGDGTPSKKPKLKKENPYARGAAFKIEENEDEMGNSGFSFSQDVIDLDDDDYNDGYE
ncbi:hypothetical protein HYALB_00004621 [Hymenoscyphus albidus]|uniref:Myb-like domain-containing protein n=1 Tax=Hymenoscyphus albidus TaxID=595503 RepID=A0A9N9LYF3_9HELO|nr:hypothetical protein HYALB_00004621 [Hymenoscyphus albidus]